MPRLVRRLKTSPLPWICTLLCNIPLAADTLEVPGEFPTIQQAIDAAFDGDEIVVDQGNWNERINTLGKSIVVRSSDPQDNDVVEATILDGTGLTGSLVTVNSGESNATTISGFTMTNADGALNGGAVFIDFGSAATISFCHLVENESLERGGAVYCAGAGSHIHNCLIEDNFAGTEGGGIYVAGENCVIADCDILGNVGGDGVGGILGISPSTTITDCHFEMNNAETPDRHSALDISDAVISGCTFESNLGQTAMVINSTITDCQFINNTNRALLAEGGTIDNCLFEGNSSNSCCPGGALSLRADGVCSNSRFLDNHAASKGGAAQSINGIFLRCEFRGNSAGSLGAALEAPNYTRLVFCRFHDHTGSYLINCTGGLSIVGCLFTENPPFRCWNSWVLIDTSVFYQQPVMEVVQNSPTMSNSIVWGSETPFTGGGFVNARNCNFSNGYPGNGNISEDPMFVDPDGPDNILGTLDDDFRLLAGSPCNDAGRNSYVAQDFLDLDNDGIVVEPLPIDFLGDPRILDCDGDGEAVVDMGAFEVDVTAPPTCAGDLNDDGTINVSDLLDLLAAWGDCNACPADLNDDGSVDVTDLLALLAAWGDC